MSSGLPIYFLSAAICLASILWFKKYEPEGWKECTDYGENFALGVLGAICLVPIVNTLLAIVLILLFLWDLAVDTWDSILALFKKKD